MVISYKKLWKLLIDKDMKKQDLRMAAQLSSSTVAKLAHGENVSTAVLLKICTALQCDISDIMEVVPDGSLASEKQLQERM
ncbi:helix-turn-helix domain-containing protein [Butyricicoccus porcorum]|uniref:helix-turn-helix domain-containing protein n=1 Tax=Butyricicoccus porcorum TaxID=1945634 RepID=UPI003F4A9B44